MATDDFSALFIKSGDMELTREMRPGDAIRNSANGLTSFQWNNLPEFPVLKKNKDYVLNMIKNGSQDENYFFIPRPDKVHWHWPISVKLLSDGLSLDFLLSHSIDRLEFISIGLLNEDQTNFINWQNYDKWEQEEIIEGSKIGLKYSGCLLYTSPSPRD